MNNKECLIVFARNPVLGGGKTRIATEAGEKNALAVYLALLNNMIKIIKPLSCYKYLFIPEIRDDEYWLTHNFNAVHPQEGKDLGQRMHKAFENVFRKEFKRAVIIGSDCFELNSEIILTAFNQLETHDCVVGPAFDGGYYLLGLKKCLPSIFENIQWSSNKTLTQTLNILAGKHMTHFRLKELHDVDTLEDVNRHELLKNVLKIKKKVRI